MATSLRRPAKKRPPRITPTSFSAVATLVEPQEIKRHEVTQPRRKRQLHEEVQRAVHSSPDENLQRYGFTTAATIERAKTDAQAEALNARLPKLTAGPRKIKAENLPQGFTGWTPEQLRQVRRAGGHSLAQDVLEKVASYGVVGPDLAKAMRGENYDPKWALIDLATAPLMVGGVGPIKGGWAAVRAVSGLRRASVPVAEQAVRAFRGEEARAFKLVDEASAQGRTLSLRERAFVNDVVRRRASAMQIETALGRARVLAKLGFSERPFRDLLLPAISERVPWAAAIKRSLKNVKPGDRIAVDVEHDLVGPHRQLGTLVEATGNRLKFTDDEQRLHTIPYGRVIWAGKPDVKPPHGLQLPSFEEALGRLGTAKPAAEISHSIAQEVIDSGLPLPDRLRDPNELAAAVDKVFELAREGADHRDWYQRAAQSAETVFRHYEQVAPGKLKRSQIAQLMAIFSLSNDPTPNMKHVVDAIEQHLAGHPVKAGMYPANQSKEAEAVFRGEGWTGRKRNSFYANMLRHLDPEEYAKLQAELGRTGSPVTADMWVVRMFAPWEKRDVPGTHYDAFEQLMTRMAQHNGWDPEEIQAAAWVAAKTRGILQGEIRRGAALGSLHRVSMERAVERGSDAYETGVKRYLRAGEPAPAGAVRSVEGDSGTQRAGADLVRGRGLSGRAGGGDLPHFAELPPTRTSARKFIDAVRRNPRGWSVSTPDLAKLKNSRVFLTEDGNAGFAIHLNGELHAVFKNPGGPRNVGYEAALQAASRGASWLNVYDVPAIRAKYEEAGFLEVARIPFNPQFAEPGVEEVGQPDVIFMAFGARPHPTRLFEDWDTAVAYTRELARPASPSGRLAREGFDIQQGSQGTVNRYRAGVREGTAMGIIGPGGRDPRLEAREALGGAASARARQESLRSEERARRAGEAEQALQAEAGQAGHYAALHRLRGELPKLQFGGFENFDQESIDALFDHIGTHPYLRTFEKIRAQNALLGVLNGRVPTRSELRLMETVFGKDTARNIKDSVPWHKKAQHLGYELWNVPRSLMASFDLSAPFRQGLVTGVRYPRIFFRNFGAMIRAFGSEKVYTSIMEDIATRPTFGMMQQAKLALTDLENLDKREELFLSNLSEHIPVVGRGVRASGRAYTGFLNKTRADVFDHLLKVADQQGINVNDDKFLTSLGRFINSATGRGDLGMMEKHALALNAMFFSPRLLYSRLNFMNPVYYARLDPFARKEALRSFRNLLGAIGLFLYMAKLGGASVNLDPRNADFAKIKIGNTRIDILGGFQQPVRLMAQMFSGKVVSSTTGKTLTLGPEGPGHLSRRDILQRFVETKLAPTPSLVNDWFKGTDFAGQPFSWKRAALQRLTPLLAQDAYDLYHQGGNVPATVALYGVGAFGIGFQTYGPKVKKVAPPAPARPRGLGGTGGSSGSLSRATSRSSGSLRR